MKRVRIFALVLCLVLLVTGLCSCSTDVDNPAELSAKKEQEIKEAYAKLLNKAYPDKGFTASNIDPRYLGTYNGAVVVLLFPNLGEGSDEQAVGYIDIDEYYITTPVKNLLVHVYKNGKFTEIIEAYEKGMLTKQDIADMAAGVVTPDGERIPNGLMTPNPTN